MRTGWTIGRGKGLSLVALIAAIAAALGVLAIPAAGQSTKLQPVASEVGVTPTEIHIAVVADVNNSIVPNLAVGARDAVIGFAKYMNTSCPTKNRCLAGRKLIVDPYDSQLNPNETRNAEIQACTNDFAMVGTGAFLMTSVDEMRNCKDKAGATTGIPEIPFITSPLVQQCSDQSFPIIAPVIDCKTKDQHPQTYASQVARGYYYTKKYGDLHGIYMFGIDSKIGHVNQVAGLGGLRDIGGIGQGIRTDGDFPITAGAQQSQYTPIIQAMKDRNSNYAQSANQFSCTVLLRKEATLQGVTDQVKVWDCSEQCYDKGFLAEGGTNVEHEYVDLFFLPFYDARELKANPMLANFVRFTGKDKVDGFGADAWAAGVAFRDAVDATVKAHGVNGLTRVNLFTALNNIHKFNADGMLGTIDLAGRKYTECHVLMQVQHGNFVRVQPIKLGTFDCNSKYVITRKLDLLTGP